MTIAATLELADAGARFWDAVVIGAGPAGAVAARELACRGADVLLVDRGSFPRWKVCGACLNGAALATLAAGGLGERVRQLGAVPLTGMRVAAWGRSVAIPLTDRVALSRQTFDAALVEAALLTGVSFLPNTWARVQGATPEARQVELRHAGREIRVLARVIVAADGLGAASCAGASDLRTVIESGSRLGAGAATADFPSSYELGTLFLACGTGGYVGLVRVEDGRLNMAGAFDPLAVRRHGGVGPLAAVVLAEGGLPGIPGLDQMAWRGTPPLTRRVVRPAAERLLLAGDAAGYVEPVTGEGMAWAMASGAAVARAAAQACRRWEPMIAAQWSAYYRHAVVERQWRCRLLAGVLRRPAVARGMASAVACFPSIFAPLVRFLQCP
jgi:2-polyprenyl-6-methoxyphenol hydroxylase-like FAD-dependent oxidoreductase